MPELNTINKQTKNSMPTFISSKYTNIVKGLADKKIQPPIFGFCTDLECMIYVSPDGIIHKILVDRVLTVEEQLKDLINPETGEPIKVTEYVQETIAPIENTVNEISADVQEIKKNGATILITTDGGDE